MDGQPLPFYYELSWHLTPDRVNYELSFRHPVYGRRVVSAWSGLRPRGPVTPQYIASTFWDASLDLVELADAL